MLLMLLACFASDPTPCLPDAPVPDEPRAAGCVVVQDGGILLVRTAGGWSIPGGSIEAGESTAEAAARETREESGVTVEAKEVACVVASKGFVAHRCEPIGGSPHADGVESFASRYVSAEELGAWEPAVFRFPDQVDAYRDALP